MVVRVVGMMVVRVVGVMVVRVVRVMVVRLVRVMGVRVVRVMGVRLVWVVGVWGWLVGMRRVPVRGVPVPAAAEPARKVGGATATQGATVILPRRIEPLSQGGLRRGVFRQARPFDPAPHVATAPNAFGG